VIAMLGLSVYHAWQIGAERKQLRLEFKDQISRVFLKANEFCDEYEDMVDRLSTADRERDLAIERAQKLSDELKAIEESLGNPKPDLRPQEDP